MACGGEGRAKKDEIGASPASAFKLRPIMCGSGEQARASACAWTTAAADVQTGAEGGGQAGIAGDNQGEPTRPAQAGKVAAKRLPSRSIVMAQDDAGESLRQAGDGGPRIRQTGFVRKEPERWEGGPPRRDGIASLDRARPGDELAIHV